MTMSKRFKKIVVLDRIILLPEQWKELSGLAEEVVQYSGIDSEQLLQQLMKEQDEDPAPMCWTQLAHEEVSKKELMRRLGDADAVITCWTNLPDDVLRESPRLEYAGFWTNLVDHRVNMELAKDLGIEVTYIPDYGTDSVAEMTLAGMLAVSRKLMATSKDALRGKWPYELLKSGQHVPSVDRIPQRMLKGKLLGLVGFGRIGQRVAELATAFGMRVVYSSRKKREGWENKEVPRIDLEELFRESDIVSIHLSPYATPRIVNRELLESMKPGAIFVNTSAGRLVDQEALLDLILDKKIYAYVDVYEGLPPRRRLQNISLRDNLFTYRAAWFTQEAVTYKGEALLRNIRRYLEA